MEENLNEQPNEQELVKEFGEEEKPKKFNPKLIGLVVVLVFAGVGTGYFLSLRQQAQEPVSRDIAADEVEVGTVVGITDKDTFKDSAEGELKKGGLDGEGSHHLERPGGESQYVYLTSSIVDLDKFVDRKVEVWGETFAGQKVGWLMDVGKVKVLE
jgi:hypothetical protein